MPITLHHFPKTVPSVIPHKYALPFKNKRAKGSTRAKDVEKNARDNNLSRETNCFQ